MQAFYVCQDTHDTHADTRGYRFAGYHESHPKHAKEQEKRAKDREKQLADRAKREAAAREKAPAREARRQKQSEDMRNRMSSRRMDQKTLNLPQWAQEGMRVRVKGDSAVGIVVEHKPGEYAVVYTDRKSVPIRTNADLAQIEALPEASDTPFRVYGVASTAVEHSALGTTVTYKLRNGATVTAHWQGGDSPRVSLSGSLSQVGGDALADFVKHAQKVANTHHGLVSAIASIETGDPSKNLVVQTELRRIGISVDADVPPKRSKRVRRISPGTPVAAKTAPNSDTKQRAMPKTRSQTGRTASTEPVRVPEPTESERKADADRRYREFQERKAAQEQDRASRAQARRDMRAALPDAAPVPLNMVGRPPAKVGMVATKTPDGVQYAKVLKQQGVWALHESKDDDGDETYTVSHVPSGLPVRSFEFLSGMEQFFDDISSSIPNWAGDAEFGKKPDTRTLVQFMRKRKYLM